MVGLAKLGKVKYVLRDVALFNRIACVFCVGFVFLKLEGHHGKVVWFCGSDSESFFRYGSSAIR